MREVNKVWLPIMLKTLRKRWNLTTKAFSDVTKIPVYLIRLIEIHNKPINEKYWPILDKLLTCPPYYKQMNDVQDAIIIRKTKEGYFVKWNPAVIDTELVAKLKWAKTLVHARVRHSLWKRGIAQLPITEGNFKIVKELRKLKEVKVIYRED